MVLFLYLFYDEERSTIIWLRSHCFYVQNQELSPKPMAYSLYAVIPLHQMLDVFCSCPFTAVRSWGNCLHYSEPQFPYPKGMNNTIYFKRVCMKNIWKFLAHDSYQLSFMLLLWSSIMTRESVMWFCCGIPSKHGKAFGFQRRECQQSLCMHLSLGIRRRLQNCRICL